ncbi:hypothetical protein [Streptomyces gilvus]|uniref:hypothetical protein n=1 Tax=Streptomyces gilvus TaxID=2920937 RepID=UPI001F0D465E|nr:hypothetical protein [Streptomyces sp. CME 23]MCH5671473.1 hypothetical protein [Streptomyces sp. CME 23]
MTNAQNGVRHDFVDHVARVDLGATGGMKARFGGRAEAFLEGEGEGRRAPTRTSSSPSATGASTTGTARSSTARASRRAR